MLRHLGDKGTSTILCWWRTELHGDNDGISESEIQESGIKRIRRREERKQKETAKGPRVA